MINITSLKIPESEYLSRSDELLSYLQSNNLSGVVLFDADYILYYSGFTFIPTERPIAFAMNSQGEMVLFVPRLELEHAKSLANINHVEYYIEYPDETHPMEKFKIVLGEMGIRDPYAADQNGYPWIFGYRGPGLDDLLIQDPHHIAGFIEDKMMIKSENEIALIQESIKWGNLAHTFLQRYTRPGATETEVSLRASTEATIHMLDSIGPIYRAQSAFSSGAFADYRGQIGRNAAIPHSLANNIVFQAGDVLVSGAGAPVWGYNSELERTMIIGPASDPQKRMFDHMLRLQELAISELQPGLPCSQVDQTVLSYYQKHDLMPFWKHHSGHAIGVRYHEGPFLDIGDPTRIEPGMVFTVEPGLYNPELGGFRHSDTVLVTEDGNEVLTYYARDLENLTIPL
jgi:Xaa-Pro aminopeptidase